MTKGQTFEQLCKLFKDIRRERLEEVLDMIAPNDGGFKLIKFSSKEQEELDRLIALGVDLKVTGECPFCVTPCGNNWCSYTPKEKK